MRRLLIIGVALALPTAIVAAAFVATFLFAKFDAPGPLTEDKIVVVPRGTQQMKQPGQDSNLD